MVTEGSNNHHSKPQGGDREVSLKEAESKDTTIGTRTDSEAGCGERSQPA